MKMTWLVIADASRAKIYAMPTRKQLNLINEFEHYASRKRNASLVSDRSGHFQKNNGAVQGGFAMTSDPQELEAVRFATQLADYLRQAGNEHCVEQIVIFAPAAFHGKLKKALHINLDKITIRFINKDYTKLSQRELEHRLVEMYLLVSR